MKALFNAAFGIVGVTVDLFSKQKKAQAFLQQVKTEIQTDPVQAADNTRHGITLECGRVLKEALKFTLATTPIEHLAPTTQQKIDQFSDYVGQQYLGILKAPIDPQAATTQLGRELFYWVIPLEEGRIVQQSGKALVKGTLNALEKIGLRLSETQIERAFTKVIHKELALAEGKVVPKLTTEELTQQVQKKAVPKTTPSATKAPNLPSWKKVKIDMEHILEGHIEGCSKVEQGANKTLFPHNLTQDQVKKMIKEAYKNGKRLRTRGGNILVEGYSQGEKIHIWVNPKTKTIETAYPRK